jgi:magnesium-transporting ATPase (P-type)
MPGRRNIAILFCMFFGVVATFAGRIIGSPVIEFVGGSMLVILMIAFLAVIVVAIWQARQ